MDMVRSLPEGTIGIFDHDTVSISNLHRQVLHTTDRVGMSKAESAEIALQGYVSTLQWPS